MIDEVTHILDSITNIKSGEGVFKETDRPLRAHEVLQELRDISSMAIDHFDEKISPALKIALNERPFLKSSTLSQSHCKCLVKFFLVENNCFYNNWNSFR